MFNSDFFTFLKPKNELESVPTGESAENASELNQPFIPDAMWIKCPKCKHLILASDMEENMKVCTKCNYHFRLTARERLDFTVDAGTFKEFDSELASKNIIGFPDYDKKLAAAKEKSGENESVVCGEGEINGISAVICVMDPGFMMGSLGTVTGEKITRAFEYALEHKLPVIVFALSGGARMQEGILSLMQMAKTSGAVKRHSDAGLLYITVLTDPTTGGVTASFAMEGDIILSEPNALIAFAGPRVIEQTIRQKLPKDFQTAEFVFEKGFIDAVVQRKDMKKTLTNLLKLHNYTDKSEREAE